ncbi:amino acid adenylation domain-containing protein [Virgibacillus salarius]
MGSSMNKILNRLLEIVSEVTKVDNQELQPDENIIEMGFDSIIFTRVNSHIKQQFGIEIPFSRIFNDLSDLNKIAAYINEKSNIVNEVETSYLQATVTTEENASNEELEEELNRTASVLESKEIMRYYSTFPYDYIEKKLKVNLEQFGIVNCHDIRVFILDDAMQLLPKGTIGNIFIGPNKIEIYNTSILGELTEEGEILVRGEGKDDANKIYPISSEQKRMYTLHKVDENSLNYNIASVVKIEGDLDVEKLENSLNVIIKRHESLRTYFAEVNGEVVQRIVDKMHISIPYSILEEDVDLYELINRERECFIKPFDLNSLPLIRIKLIKVKTNFHVMLLDTHHIIADGASSAIFLHELMTHYSGQELDDLTLQYKDYILQKEKGNKDVDKRKQETYWKNVFADGIPTLDIHSDYSRPYLQTFNGDNVSFILSHHLSEKIDSFCRVNHVTPYMFFFTCINILLAKYSGQQDIVIGSTLDRRKDLQTANLIGMFVNTIPIRNYIDTEEAFVDVLDKVKTNVLQATDHADYPFEELVDLLDTRRDKSRNPIFDVLYTFQNNLIRELNSPSINIRSDEIKTKSSKVDLFFEVNQEKEYAINIEYNTDIYSEQTIKRMAKHFSRLTENVLDNTNNQISDIPIITPEERDLILNNFNNVNVLYPKEKTVHQLFEEQVEKYPNHIAVKDNKEELTYRDLNVKANQLARKLRNLGVQADSIIALMVDKSIELIIGILGILKAGGAYLPIDPKLPKERKEYMLTDSQTKLVVTNTYMYEGMDDVSVVNLSDTSIFQEGDARNLKYINYPSDLAYIIYTSGTTGNPKGVMIEHKNVVRLMKNDDYQFDFSEKDVWTLFHSQSFDFSVWEIFGALLYGGKLIIVSDEVAMDTTRFRTLLENEKVTVLNQTPTAFYNLMKIEMEETRSQLSLRYIIFGGEALKPIMLKDWMEKYKTVKLINMYGITETTVHVTFKELKEEDLQSGISNIGKAIHTLMTVIVDENLRLQPIGVPGELCVIGDGVARGYLNQEKLTSIKFVDNSYVEESKLYHSGDLVRLLPSGEMEYLGRMDNQVKIRGYRIELGEIEYRLISHPDIKEAVVVAQEGEPGQKYLCAYIVAKCSMDKSEIKAYLKESLPDYMIPAYFMELMKIPLTNNGKVNRKALPKPDVMGLISEAYEAPKTPTQKILTSIWQNVLGVESIGIHDSFFDLGGHSLKATTVMSEVHKVLEVSVPLKELFNRPTIQELSDYIDIKGVANPYKQIEPCVEKEYYQTSSAQKRMYSVQQLEKESTAYNMPGVFMLEGEIDIEQMEETLHQLIARHEVLRTYFVTVDGEIVQKIKPTLAFHLPVRTVDETDITSLSQKLIRPFVLEEAPLFRAEILKAHRTYYLLIDMHHIISDGVSVEIFMNEFKKLYNGESMEPLRIQYKDYAEWQYKYLKNDHMKEEARYWQEQFQDKVPMLQQLYDYERPAFQSFEGDSLAFTIKEGTTKKLQVLVKQEDVTLQMILLSAFNILLAKYSGQEDIVVGVPIAGRPHADLQNIMGVFVNTLAMRNQPTNDKTFSEFLKEVKQNSLLAYDNQNYPLEELIDELNIKRIKGRNPLFDVLFDMTNLDLSKAIQINNLSLKPKLLTNNIAKMDLSLVALEKKQHIEMSIEYSSQLFKKETVARIAEDFQRIIEIISTQVNIQLGNIEIRSEEERQSILQEDELLNELKDQEFSF